MHQVLFPLVIVTILKQHGSKEQPLTISQIADALEESEEKIQEIADSIQKDKSPL